MGEPAHFSQKLDFIALLALWNAYLWLRWPSLMTGYQRIFFFYDTIGPLECIFMAPLALFNDGGTRAFFSFCGFHFVVSSYGANKHHRQRKFVRRSTKHSGVQSTCKMSRGWMMRRELRSEVLVGRVTLATMDRSSEGT